jgi:hypothetical protein
MAVPEGTTEQIAETSTQDKNSLSLKLKVDSITLGRDFSCNRGKNWDKLSVSLTVKLQPGDNLDNVVSAINLYIKKKIDDFIDGVNRIYWETRTGPKGLFELASEKWNGDIELFESLRQELRKNNSLTLDNYFYWLMPDGKNVARKKVSE